MRRALLLLTLTGCVTVSAPVADSPCRGAELDLDALVETCTVHEPPHPPPTEAELRAELVPPDVALHPGEETRLRVRLTNATAAPLVVDLTLGCLAFTASALNPDGSAADYESEALGGLCANGDPVRLTLEPDGWVEKAVPYRARKVKQVCPGEGPCQEQPAGDLPPGSYRLEVTLPFLDAAPEGARSRSVAGRLEVAP